MKKIIFQLATLMLMFSCANENIELSKTETETSVSNVELARNHKFTRGIYVNDFATIVGTEDEIYLLKWCQANKFNRVNLYNINAITTNNMLPELHHFIDVAKNQFDISVSIIASGSTSATNATNYFNDVNYPNKMDSVTTEYEFWNSGFNFTNFIPLTNQLNNLNVISANTVQKEVYLGKILDYANVFTQTQIATHLISNYDKIILVNYVANAQNYNSAFQNKLQVLANVAASMNKSIKIEVLFSVNTSSIDPNIFDYVNINTQNHNFIDAYSNFMIGYNAAIFSNKSRINISGYHFYRYSNAVLARPL